MTAQRAGEWSIGEHALQQQWATVRCGQMSVESDRQQHVFEGQISLNALDPDVVRVELYAEGSQRRRPDPIGDDARSPTAKRGPAGMRIARR